MTESLFLSEKLLYPSSHCHTLFKSIFKAPPEENVELFLLPNQLHVQVVTFYYFKAWNNDNPL